MFSILENNSKSDSKNVVEFDWLFPSSSIEELFVVSLLMAANIFNDICKVFLKQIFIDFPNSNVDKSTLLQWNKSPTLSDWNFFSNFTQAITSLAKQLDINYSKSKHAPCTVTNVVQTDAFNWKNFLQKELKILKMEPEKYSECCWF